MKFLWLDMEMTGLDVNKEVILEVAAIVTDIHFNEVDSFHAVVKQPQSYLDAMDSWNTEQHARTGLVAEVPRGEAPEKVEEKLVEFVEDHFGSEKVVIAGNTIGQDRAFVDRYWPNLAKRFHYRMVDVTAWKVVMAWRFGVSYQKQNEHRAMEDIRESIEELKHYLSFVHVEPTLG